MKKIYLIFLLLPVLSFSQVDLASWALTSNANATVDTYATASLTVGSGLSNPNYSAAGLNAADWTASSYALASLSGDSYELKIAPKTGEALYINNLQLSHIALGTASGGNKAPTNYQITWYKSSSPLAVTTLVTGLTTTAANTVNNLGINTYLASGETLVVNMYAWNGGNSNNARWQVNSNSLKINGFSRLCGDYIIGSAAATLPFKTLTSAVTAVNTLGVSCAVRYLVDENQTTTTNYIINQFLGTSATNTLTIRPNTGKNITIQVNNVDQNSNTSNVFALNGADNIIFDGNNDSADNNLTIFRNNSSNQNLSTSVIMFYSSAEQNFVRNLVIQSTTGNSNAWSYGIISSDGTFSGQKIPNAGNNNNNEIDKVTFKSVFFPVHVSGVAAASNTNWKIKNSIINSATGARSGFYIANSNGAVVSGNNIDPITYSQDVFMYAGIYVAGDNVSVSENIIKNINLSNNNGTNRFGIGVVGANALLYKNIIQGISGGNVNVYGAYVSGTSAVVTFNDIYNLTSGGTDRLAAGIYIDGASSTVYNNMINEVKMVSANNSGGGHGIYLNSANNAKIYFNSIRLATNQNGGRSSCLNINSGTSLDVRNNLFINLQSSGGSRYAVYSSVSSPFATVGYNDYVSSHHIGYLNGANRTTIANWRTITGETVITALNVTPVFVSSTDLHIDATNAGNLANLDARGTTIAGITIDIDSEIRNASMPDIGADEWGSKCSGVTTTWNGTSWSNGAPTATSPVFINGNYNTGTNGNINACELTVNAGFILTIGSGGFVKVEYGITTVGSTGKIVVENNASLIQVDDTVSATSPGLNVTVIRTSTPLKYYDYTYWSSPVVGAILDTVSAPSLFYEWNASVLNTGQWVNLSWAYVMLPGSGYIARAPTNLDWANNPTVTATFNGRVNSGVINKTIYLNGTSINNLIGNPYPSALDAKAFLIANQANISGNLYFWTHQTAISGQAGEIQTYTSDDYAVYNLTGSVGTGKGNTGTNGEVVANRPNGQIASGQAFFVEALNNNVNVQFTNAMRTSTTNTQFFKTAPTKTAQGETVDNSRVWLSLTNEQGAYAETLVGYIEDATNDLDNLFDAMKYDGGNYVSVYSLIGSDKLVIQGRGLPFSDSDIVPLGYNSTVAGTFKISLEEFDGLFMGQDVYLLDKLTDVSTKLNDGAYTFTTEIGTFNNRFELRYTNATLGVDNPIATNEVVIFTKANHIEVKSDMQDIQSIAIYDLLGRSIYANDKINAIEFSTKELGFHSQVVIVKVKMADNSELTKKVILK